jgi:hypothetical protein
VRRSQVGLAIALWVSAGCAGPQQQRVALDAERLARAQAVHARERAPELYARVEQARRDAEASADGDPARADHATEARLWLEAAITEAQRAQLADERLGVEREVEQAEQQLTGLELARAELAREVERRTAAELARSEAQKALDRASLTPRLRPKLAKDEVRAAAEALLARATLIRAALPADAALDAALASARAALAGDPDAALDKADAALARAQLALGAERARSPGPSEAESSSLAEAMLGAGARPTRGDRGLSALLPAAFAAQALKPEARGRLARLCKLAAAHPHGPVRAAVGGGQAAAGRARAVGAELVRAGCEGGRFGVDVTPAATDDVELSWLAY